MEISFKATVDNAQFTTHAAQRMVTIAHTSTSYSGELKTCSLKKFRKAVALKLALR